jgi:ArsR family transcriptional regulator
MKDATNLFFDAFANKNRFRILTELRDKDFCAGELQKSLNIEQTHLSHNLKCLLDCKFINVRKDGKKRIYSINKETKGLVDEVIAHVEKYEEYLRRCGVLAGRRWKSTNTQ